MQMWNDKTGCPHRWKKVRTDEEKEVRICGLCGFGMHRYLKTGRIVGPLVGYAVQEKHEDKTIVDLGTYA